MRRRPGGSRVIRGAACATAELQRHCRIRGALHSPCRHRPELRAGVEIPKPKQRFVLEKKPLRRVLSRLHGVRLRHPVSRGLRPVDCARRGEADHVGRAKIPIRCGSRIRHARPTWIGIYVRRSQLLHHRPPSTYLGAGHFRRLFCALLGCFSSPPASELLRTQENLLAGSLQNYCSVGNDDFDLLPVGAGTFWSVLRLTCVPDYRGEEQDAVTEAVTMITSGKTS